MLSRLHISNFGLVEKLELSFDAGLTVITGETGAGKSLLAGALGFLLGEKASAELVRTGAARTYVEGIFSHLPDGLPGLLEEGGIDLEDELILRRELNAEGSTRAFANGCGVTAGFLRRLGEFLVDFHGQHEHQSLLNPSNHRWLLDGVVVAQDALAEMTEIYTALKERQKAWNDFLAERKLSPEEAELLSFQIQEIKSADLSDGEEAKLLSEKKVLENVEKLGLSLQTVLALLDEGEASASVQLAAALREFRRSETFDSSFSDWARRLESLSAELGEIAREAEGYRFRLDASPERLSEALERLDLYQRLKRKYGGSVAAVLKFMDSADERLAAYTSQKSIERQLRDEVRQAEKSYLEAAARISELRRQRSPKFVQQLSALLRELALKDAAFEVRFGLKESKEGIELDGSKIAYDSAGYDQIEFFFSANPGEEPKPLAKTASGGELSRLMLALKLLAAGKDKPATLVFDEIDQGLGGETAYRVGEKLLEASRHYQIFCITHLQQIAALASHHLLVSKEKAGARNLVKVERLSEKERKAEIARMLAGSRAGEAALKQAEEMLVGQRAVIKMRMAAKPARRK